MKIESISYHSIVNRYMHNDHTLIFARIATLHLSFSDSTSLDTDPAHTYTIQINLDGIFINPCLKNLRKFLFKMSRTLARSKHSNRTVTYYTIGAVRKSENHAQESSLQ